MSVCSVSCWTKSISTIRVERFTEKPFDVKRLHFVWWHSIIFLLWKCIILGLQLKKKHSSLVNSRTKKIETPTFCSFIEMFVYFWQPQKEFTREFYDWLQNQSDQVKIKHICPPGQRSFDVLWQLTHLGILNSALIGWRSERGGSPSPSSMAVMPRDQTSQRAS